MWDVRACRCCLTTGPGLKPLENPFDYYYTIISDLDLYEGDGYPKYICYECKSRLQIAYAFRKKCYAAFTKMKSVMATKHEVTLSNIKKIDRRNFRSTLGLWNASAQYCQAVVASAHLDKKNTEQVCNVRNEKAITKIIIPTCSPTNEHINMLNGQLRDQFTSQSNEQDCKLFSTLKDNLFYKTDDGFTISVNEYGYVKELSVETQFLAIKMWTEDETYKLAKLKCDNCHEIFSSLPALIHHNDKHTTLNKQYQCNICHASFKNKKFLTQHQSDLHLWKIVCKHCGYVCHVVKVFYNHLKSEHREIMTYLPDNYDPVSVSDKAVQKNMNVNERKDRLVAWPRFCLYCNKKLANSEQYKTHYREKHPIKPCTQIPHKVCKSCGRTFTKYKFYASHIKQGLCVPKKMYKCRECDMKTCELKTMFQHLIQKHKEDPHKCQVCPKLFKMDNSCKKHISTLLLRSVEYKCYVCGDEYDSYESLVKHQKSHIIQSDSTTNLVANPTNDQSSSQIDEFQAKFRKHYHFLKNKLTQKSLKEYHSDIDCTSTRTKMLLKRKLTKSSNRKKERN